MSTLYISEYISVHIGAGGVGLQGGLEPSLDQTPITITGASATSAPFAAATQFVRVHTDAICSIAFGSAPTATVANKRLAANQTEYFGVIAGQSLAVIANT